MATPTAATLSRLAPFKITTELPGYAGAADTHGRVGVEVLPGATVTAVTAVPESHDVIITIHGRNLRVPADWLTVDRISREAAAA